MASGYGKSGAELDSVAVDDITGRLSGFIIDVVSFGCRLTGLWCE